MAEKQANVVQASSAGPKLPDGVIGIEALESSAPVSGCTVFTHYNGPTDELSGLAARHVRPRPRLELRILRISIPRRNS